MNIKKYLKYVAVAVLAIASPMVVTSCYQIGAVTAAKIASVVRTTDSVLTQINLELTTVKTFLGASPAATTVEQVQLAVSVVKGSVDAVATFLNIDVTPIARTGAVRTGNLKQLTDQLEKETKALPQ